MMTLRIDIDFAPRPSVLRSRRSWGLAVVVACLGGAVAYDGFEVNAGHQALNDQLKAVQSVRPNRRETGPVVPTEQLDAANRVIDAIDWPWEALLGAVERAGVDAATLLSVEPDPERRELRLQGEAKDSLAMLAFVRALSGQTPLTNVYLAGHQISLQGNQRAVRFTVQASWREDTLKAAPLEAPTAPASLAASGSASRSGPP